MFSDNIPDICKKTSLPCPAGEKFRDAVTCREYYECGHNGQFLTKRLCPPTKEFNPRRGHCVLSTTFKCPPPIRCPNLSWNGDYFTRNRSNFPTDYVVGGVLGSLAILTVLILLLACIHKWRMGKSRLRHILNRFVKGLHGGMMYTKCARHLVNLCRRRLHQLRKNLRRRPMVPVLENQDYFNDKLAQIYERISNNNSTGVSCLPYPSAFRPVAIRHHPISQIRYPHPLGDIDSLGSSDPAIYVAGGRRDDSYEPSVIAGSFIYHGPGNLPSHLAPTAKEYDRDLSYDSFRNEHLFSNNSRGVLNSTATTRQVHL